jgi:hypothetical protein
MDKIYSKIDTDELLHIIVPFSDFDKPRNEIVPATEFIQGAAICTNDKDSFRPHKHIWKPFVSDYNFGETKTQEFWVIMKGIIEVTLYDTDDSVLDIRILKEGDAMFTLHGGHAFTCLKDDTKVWEIKTGPYKGLLNDKIFIQ